MNKDKHIEGLEDLYAACIAESRYYEEKEKRHYREDYRPLEKPSPSSEELKVKYPIAALFLKAESYTESSNVDKFSAGQKALDLIYDDKIEEAKEVLRNWLPAEAYNN